MTSLREQVLSNLGDVETGLAMVAEGLGSFTELRPPWGVFLGEDDDWRKVSGSVAEAVGQGLAGLAYALEFVREARAALGIEEEREGSE